MASKTIHINNEKELIRRAKDKDRRAQKAIYDAYSDKMMSICLYYISDYHFAEDVMIKGFFKAFTKLNDFKENSSLYTWLKRIMSNECIDFLRSKNQKFKYAEWDNSIDFTDEEMDEEYDIKFLEEIINTLPEGCRIIFNLFVIEDMKHNEIAEKLNISVGTSKSQLSYAKKYIKEQLKLIQNVQLEK